MGGERDTGPLEGRPEKQTHWALARVTGLVLPGTDQFPPRVGIWVL